VNDALNAPIGSSVILPSSRTKFSASISINCLSSGISTSLACDIADATSLEDMPEYLSLASFVILF
jgi:hypothetical protein